MSFASSQREKQKNMKKNDSYKVQTDKSETDWERLEKMSDDDIDFSDIPELTEDDFKRMKPASEFLKERGIQFDPNEPIMITEHREDGTSTTYELPPPKERMVMLDPDVREYFPDSESVNRTLRSLIKLIPQGS